MRALIPRFIKAQHLSGAREGQFSAVSLFADISGFTSLTEYLMRQEKDGAEVLARVLGEVFGPMVRNVDARGGIIPLFAGDAFAALFPVVGADPHAAGRQALHTALFIRDFLTREPGGRQFVTTYGTFSIGVKVGLSAGAVRWGMPRAGGRSLFYFRGPALDGAAGAQARAQAGEVVADRAFRAHLDAPIDRVGNEPFRRIRSHPTPVEDLQPDPPIFTRDELLPFLPERILDSRIPGEFRDVAPVFLSFEEPDDVADLHGLSEALMAEADRCGGYLTQLAFGDKGAMAVVLFGAPIAREGAADRAAEFLLRLRSADLDARWRAGSTFGKVWAGFGGGDHRSEYVAIGDTMNLAARLATQAPWGEIWADDGLRRQVGTRRRFRNLGTHALKGKQARTPVVALMPAAEPGGDHGFAGTLIGRERELATLEDAIRPVLEGRFGGVITVHGDAGVGKTRLMSEVRGVLSRSTGLSWLTVPADEILRRPLGPFRRFLQGHFSQSPRRSVRENTRCFDEILDSIIESLPRSTTSTDVATELHRTRSCLGALIDLTWEGSLFEQLGPPLRLENTRAALKALFKAESLRRPTVVLMEDIHWVDPVSTEFVSFLTRALSPFPLIILATSRFTDDGERVRLPLDPDVAQRDLDLDALTPDALHPLATQLLGGEPSPGFIEYLRERSGGNPFFVEQLVLDLIERGALANDGSGRVEVDDAASIEVPVNVNAVLTARLDRLTVNTTAVVQTAAVLGREFDTDVLSRMVGADVRRSVTEATDRGIWSSAGNARYAFDHALMRDAAYDMQQRSWLREQHARAGHAIEHLYPDDLAAHAAELAHHFRQAEEPRRERTYTRLAAGQALEACDFTGAHGFLERTLALPSTSTEQDDVEVHRLIGTCHFALGDFPGATESFTRSLDMASAQEDRLAETAARTGLGDVAHKQGEYDTVREIAEQNMRAYESMGRERGVADSLHRLALAHMRQGAPARARECSERSLAIHESLGDRRGIATDLNTLGDIVYRSGQLAEAARLFEQALEVCRETNDQLGVAATLSNLANAASEQGDEARAAACHEESLAIRRQIGEKHGIAASLNNLAYLPYSKGEFGEAQRYIEGSLEVAREIGEPHIISMNLNNLGMIAGLNNDLEAAQRYFEEGVALARRLGEPWGIAHTLCGLANVQLRVGDRSAARVNLMEALTRAHALAAASLAMEAVAGLAGLHLQETQSVRAAELAALVDAHPATEVDVKLYTLKPLQAALAAALSSEELTAATERGRSLDPERVIADMLGRPDDGTES